MTTTSLAAALILGAVLCNSGAAQFPDGGGAYQFRGFPYEPFSIGGAAEDGFGVPGWGRGGWIPGFPFAGSFGFPGAAMGTWRPWVVCRERGPCYGKKLTCPAKCFSYRSLHTKGFAGRGGGGGCTFDCTRRCAAFC